MLEGASPALFPKTAKVFTDRTPVTLRELQLPPEGPPFANTGYLTASELQTSGGLLSEVPILLASVLPQNLTAQQWLAALGLVRVTNLLSEIPTIESATPFMQNMGSVPFAVEATRNTRLVTDWVYDETANRTLMLLSNPKDTSPTQLWNRKQDKRRRCSIRSIET